MASDGVATRTRRYDDRVVIDAATIEPTVTWGINPGQSVGVDEADRRPNADDEALAFMGFTRGQPVAGTRIDVAFIGSCTNGRLSDLEEAARFVKGRRVAPHVKALVVPGSQAVAARRRRRGSTRFLGGRLRMARRRLLDVPAMNPDRLEGRQVCASSSNRNFKGRQGSPTGRTLLMSPAMVAAAADRRRSRRRPQSSMSSRMVSIAHNWQPHSIRSITGRALRCAATNSTPIASCRRDSASRSPSKGSNSTSSRTIARPTPDASVQQPAVRGRRACWW